MIENESQRPHGTYAKIRRKARAVVSAYTTFRVALYVLSCDSSRPFVQAATTARVSLHERSCPYTTYLLSTP